VNSVVETYSRLASEYDDPKNIDSCWGCVAQNSLEFVRLQDKHKVVVDSGCGTGRQLAELAARSSPHVQLIGVEPALNMRKIAIARTDAYPNVRILDGSFESLPFESGSIDYLYSTLAFHWVSDLDKSVAELARVMKRSGEMDLMFIGRHNGREFIRKTTPVFFRYMTPAMMVESASLRKQLTVQEAVALFGKVFESAGLSVQESYHTYYDTLDGHWRWWVRVEGQFLKIPPAVRTECDREVRDAISTLATDKGVPYTVHLIHVRVRQT